MAKKLPKPPKAPNPPKPPTPRYGIAEWYGRRIETLTPIERASLAETALNHSKQTAPNCPFRTKFAGGEPKPCHKKGGTCSFQQFDPVLVASPVPRIRAKAVWDGAPRGNLAAFCPSRFYEDTSLFRTVGSVVLGTQQIAMAKEVDFLTSTVTGRPAGSIDWVLFEQGKPANWCALELQAVYFSGEKMRDDFEAYASYHRGTFIWPTKNRRPDFRSSGPKRLMPQLMIKVPTLRRWGKKCAVIVDHAFFTAMPELNVVSHVSNADIVWFVLTYEPDGIRLRPENIRFTTLEASVDGLTGGTPVPLPVFEEQLQKKPVVSVVDFGAVAEAKKEEEAKKAEEGDELESSEFSNGTSDGLEPSGNVEGNQ